MLDSALTKSINYFNRDLIGNIWPQFKKKKIHGCSSWHHKQSWCAVKSTNICAGLRSSAQWVLFLRVIYLKSLELSKFIFYMQLYNLFGVNMDINSSLQLCINICWHSRYFKFRIQEGKCSQDWLLSYIPFYFNVLCQEESITSNESGKKRARAITNSFIVILTILPSDHRITFMLKYLKRLCGHILPSWVCSSTHWDLYSRFQIH